MLEKLMVEASFLQTGPGGRENLILEKIPKPTLLFLVFLYQPALWISDDPEASGFKSFCYVEADRRSIEREETAKDTNVYFWT